MPRTWRMRRIYMNGYMNGASTEEEPKTINKVRTISTTTSGTSHHFFSCFRNSRSSLQSRHIQVFGAYRMAEASSPRQGKNTRKERRLRDNSLSRDVVAK